MAGTSALLLAQGISGGIGVANSMGNAYASYLRGRSEEALYKADASMAAYQGQDAIRRGDYEANRLLFEARKLVGQQRVGFAASGVKVNTGSAADVVDDTAMLGAIDATMIKNNALREAFGYKTKEISARLAAKTSRIQGRFGTAMSVASGIAGGIKTGLELKALNDYYGGLEWRSSGIGAGVSRDAVRGVTAGNASRGVRF